MVSFVILHYNNISDTEKCVSSILNSLKSETFSIVIVDNKSPDGTGILLQKKYAGFNEIEVLLNQSNAGFSKGNNAGCNHAINKFNPDFICVFNNDTFIDDSLFIKKIYDTYQSGPFDALGPAIWNIQRNYNQNPFKIISSEKEALEELETLRKAKRLLNSWLPYTYYLFLKYSAKNKTYKSVSLHGAAIIFSKRYFQRFSNVFPELTFLFGEENFLYYRKIKHKLDYRFNFDLKVFHNHSSTTKKIAGNVVKKWKYQHENIEISLKTILDLYKSNADI